MLGKMLKEQRTKRKIRQEDVAKQIGIARTTYAMYEQGKREPDNETLQKLADFFEVSIDYLLGREEANFSQFETNLKSIQKVFEKFAEGEKITDADIAVLMVHIRDQAKLINEAKIIIKAMIIESGGNISIPESILNTALTQKDVVIEGRIDSESGQSTYSLKKGEGQNDKIV